MAFNISSFDLARQGLVSFGIDSARVAPARLGEFDSSGGPEPTNLECNSDGIEGSWGRRRGWLMQAGLTKGELGHPSLQHAYDR